MHQTPQRQQHQEAGNMFSKIARVLLPLAVVGALLSMSVATAREARVELNASVQGSASYAEVHGKAVYKERGSERQVEVEVEDANRLAGQRLVVRVGGQRIGTITVNALGAGEISRNSDLGQAVPTVKPGTKVTLKTGAGVLVASGTFR
jgi:hypothetical protein